MEWDGINRRRTIRYKFPFTIHIKIPDKPAVSTYTEDISKSGVKVSLRENIKPNSPVGLTLFLRRKPVLCRGKIQWVQERKSKLLEKTFFDTGIELLDVKDEDKDMLEICIKGHQDRKEQKEN